ncbi:hypothetical protein P5G61_06985 [Paenibacillus sp. F6_3S_P_1C]|uniref:Uncharacterized protein n=1 Tax=Paenibacillus vandeheii TaxID=3035917 RepID=A0ABT8J9R2_9BACL|nr:hypothetical protein [Paenibacillus vandeheii]MDN4600959.1 hypothetical protein [Paenibacillus vandeheii]
MTNGGLSLWENSGNENAWRARLSFPCSLCNEIYGQIRGVSVYFLDIAPKMKWLEAENEFLKKLAQLERQMRKKKFN